MKVVYLINDSCFYQRLLWFSLTTLRYYNPDIPVEILYFCDNERDSRGISDWNNIDLGIPWFTKQSFLEALQPFNVTVQFVEDFDMGEEVGYGSMHRKELHRVEGSELLLMDADTFILDDIVPLFAKLKEHDIWADKTAWGDWGGKYPLMGDLLRPFNSGVVLFGKGLMQEYGRACYKISLDIKKNIHPIGEWLDRYLDLHRVNHPKAGREEVGFTVWIHENKLDYGFFDRSEVQTVRYTGNTKIYHTMTNNYPKNLPRFFDKGKFLPPQKIKPKYVPKYLYEKRKKEVEVPNVPCKVVPDDVS